MAKIIGITGRAGSGKDTVARHLTTYFKAHFRSVAFADPIRSGLKAVFGWDDSYFDYPKKEEVIEMLGKSPRQIMQTFGTEWGRDRVNTDLWLKLAGIRMENLVGAGFNVLVTDVRFQNEADWIRQQGGVIWHLDRDGSSTTSAHKSEAGVNFVIGDKRIDNNETLGWLIEKVEGLAVDLLAEEVEKEAARVAARAVTAQAVKA